MLIFYLNIGNGLRFFISLFIFFIFFQVVSLGNAMEIPKFEHFSINAKGQAVIKGHAQQLSLVELYMGAKNMGQAKADEIGNFTLIIQNPLKTGVFQFVLRADNRDGSATTSIQTANIIIVGEDAKDMIAYVQEANGVKKFISDNFHIIKANFKTNADFDVQHVIYKNGTLKMFGKGPAGGQIMFSLGKMRLGREKIKEDGSFLLVRLIKLPSSDQIFRLDLFSDYGEIIATLGVPFELDYQTGILSQVYKAGVPIRTIFVENGATLYSIAKKVYGDSRYMENIFEENKDILIDKHRLKIGQELLLPK